MREAQFVLENRLAIHEILHLVGERVEGLYQSLRSIVVAHPTGWAAPQQEQNLGLRWEKRRRGFGSTMLSLTAAGLFSALAFLAKAYDRMGKPRTA